MTRAIIVKREGAYVITAQGAELAASLAAQSKVARDASIVARDAAAESAAFAEEFSGPAYADVAAGEAATTTGQFFRVPVPATDPVEYTRYQRTSGGSVEAAALATTTALAAPTGGEMVGFSALGDDAVEADVLAKARQVVADRDFTNGLVGALAAVRNTDDTSFSGTVSVPNGIVARSAAMVMPQIHARVSGNGGGTYFMQAAVPAFSWSGVASAAQSEFAGFGIYNGTHGFDITPSGEVASLNFTNVRQTLGTGALFNVSGGLTTCVFRNISQLGGTYGIYSAGGVNNHNAIDQANFGELTESAVRIENLTQGLVLRNVRVEAGGTDGKAVYDFEGAVGVRVLEGWYEAHHEYLLKLDATSSDGTVIDGIVDAGASHAGGALKGSLFDVGEKLVEFRTNTWFETTVAPKNVLWTGINDRLYAASSNVWEHKSQRGGKVHQRQRNIAVDTAVFDILTFSRTTASPDALTNLQNVSGILTLTYMGVSSVTGLAAKRTERWPVTITGVGVAYDLEIGTVFGGNTGFAGSVTVVPSEKAGGTSTSKTLKVTVTNNAGSGQCLVDASFEFDANSNLATNLITVTAL
jgi:hypothetical protein